MATELRNSEIIVLHGDPVRFDGLDGDPRPNLIAEVQAAQKKVDEAAARIHDKSPEAIARRRPFILENLARVLDDHGSEHPYYLRSLKNARDGGYLPEPAPFREPAERFRTVHNLRQSVAV